MISSPRQPRKRDEAYVWTWLPLEVTLVVASRIARDGEQLIFSYGQS